MIKQLFLPQIVVSVLLLLALAVFGIYWYMPVALKSDNQALEIQSLTYRLKEKVLVQKKAEILLENKQLLLALEKKLERDYKTTLFSEQLYSAAVKNDLILLEEKYLDNSEGEKGVRILVQGSYESLRQFLNQLSGFDYVISIKKLMIKKNQQSIQARIEMRILSSKGGVNE